MLKDQYISLPVIAGTHPDIASLVAPLFAARKEGELHFFPYLHDIGRRYATYPPYPYALLRTYGAKNYFATNIWLLTEP